MCMSKAHIHVQTHRHTHAYTQTHTRIHTGTHVNGYIVDSAFTWAPDQKYEELLAAVKVVVC